LASDALALKPTAKVTDEGRTGRDCADFEFDFDLRESLTGSSSAFRELVQGDSNEMYWAEELRMLIGEMGQTAADGVERLPNLRKARKRAMLESTATNWGNLGELSTVLTADQRTIRHAQFAQAMAIAVRS
jgi:hypothetical protein